MSKERQEPPKRKGPREDVEALEENLSRAQELHAQSAQELGYQLEIVRAVKPFWSNINEDLIYGSAASGAIILSTWREHSEDWVHEAKQQSQVITMLSGSASNIASSSSTSEYIYSASPAIDHERIRRLTEQRQSKPYVADRLRRLDPSLASTYTTLWGYMHLPALDPSRGPLFLMRQVFDHLLEHLAPDVLVMKETGFVPDKELKQRNGKGVTRRHRIVFVAETKLRDPATKDLVLQTTDNFLAIYEELNQAHNRGVISQESAQDAVYTGDSLLLIWLKALEKS